MNLDEIRAEIELDLTWRQNEIRFLRNQLAYISSEQDRDRYRKSLVVMLYSHYEGFCKTALSIYADAINKESIKCLDAHECIVAAALADTFKDLENPNKKSKIFVNVLPDDSQLHRFARQVELIEKLDNIWQRVIQLPIEVVIDMESNLTPVVLKKVLYRLGFPYDMFKDNEGRIHLLLNRRNNVAHGVRKDGISEKEYSEIEIAAYDIMRELIRMIYTALKNEIYLKATSRPTT